MKECSIRFTDHKHQKVWSYQVDRDQAVKVQQLVTKLLEERHSPEPRGTLEGLFGD